MLSINCESFLQYYFWFGLNDVFRSQYVQLTNATRPTLSSLNHKFFVLGERYNNALKHSRLKLTDYDSKFKIPKKESSMASKVDISVPNDKHVNNSRACSLCSKDSKSEADHPIYKCQIYNNASSKISRIKLYHGCEKCSSLSHPTNQCKFKLFKRCKHCSMWYFSFLCTRIVSEPADKVNVSKMDRTQKDRRRNNPENETSNLLSIVNAMPNVLDTLSIIPTFTCTLPNNQKLRCLKDIGCQSNFIRTVIADQCNLKIMNRQDTLKVKDLIL